MATKANAKKTKTTATLSAPWYVFADTLTAIFENDESVNISVPKGDEEESVFEIVVSCDNAIKLAAIKKLVGESRDYGNVKLLITYFQEDAPMTKEDVVAAFGDTGYFDKVVSASTPCGDMNYIVMKKDVLQVYIDNTRDYYGNMNVVVAAAMEDIIQDSVKTNDVAICTRADKDPEK